MFVDVSALFEKNNEGGREQKMGKIVQNIHEGVSLILDAILGMILKGVVLSIFVDEFENA